MAVSLRSRSCLASLQVLNFYGPCSIYNRGADITLGGVIGCFPACTAQVSPPERIGSRLGFVLFVMSFSTLTGPPLSGSTCHYGVSMDHRLTPSTALLDHSIPSNMYFSNGFFCGGVMIIGALFILLAKLSIDRQLFKVI